VELRDTSDHHRLLAHRTTGLLRHRRPLEWTHRSDQPINQKDQARRPRIPQLRQLPAPPPAALRRRLGHHPRHPDQRPATTLSGVEPLNRRTYSPVLRQADIPDVTPFPGGQPATPLRVRLTATGVESVARESALGTSGLGRRNAGHAGETRVTPLRAGGSQQ
jgi:hypothetical protein